MFKQVKLYKLHHNKTKNHTHSVADVTSWFTWSTNMESAIDSSFFWGYLVTQIPGGFLASFFPANQIFGAAIVGSAFCNMFIPLCIYLNPIILICVRIIQGLVEVRVGVVVAGRMCGTKYHESRNFSNHIDVLLCLISRASHIRRVMASGDFGRHRWNVLGWRPSRLVDRMRASLLDFRCRPCCPTLAGRRHSIFTALSDLFGINEETIIFAYFLRRFYHDTNVYKISKLNVKVRFISVAGVRETAQPSNH